MSASRLAPFAYTPGRSALHRAHPFVAAAPLVALGVVAFAFESPLLVFAVCIAAALLGRLAGVGPAVRGALRIALPLAALMVLVNGLVADRGTTILLRGPDLPLIGGPLTLEALSAGAVIGLRVIAAGLLFAVWSACVDPDRVLQAARPLARRSALTASLVSRLVPVAVSDLDRLREAAALRGPGAAPVGRAALANRLVAGSLDRSVEIAATLELRGHSLPRIAGRGRGHAIRAGIGSLGRDPWPLVSALLIACIAVGVAVGPEGGGGFDPYPTLSFSPGIAGFALAFALIPCSLLALARPAQIRGSKAGTPR